MTASRSSRAGWLAAAVAVIVAAGVAFALAYPRANPHPSSSGQHGAGRHSNGASAIAEPTPRTTAGPKAPRIPARGVYLGAYAEPPVFSQAADIEAVSTLQAEIGRPLAIVHSYLQWQAPFPTRSQLTFMQQGHLLLLSWAGTDTRAIISGADDSWIRARALAIKATHEPMFLQWRWEMNRPDLQQQLHSPADFIAAWDHIRAIFASEHVRNVAWVWCPSSKGFGNSRGYLPAAAYYPGNKEVDWLCVDAYPWPGQHVSFSQLLRPFLAWAAHIDKPIMIGELGISRLNSARQRARYLRGVAQTVREYKQIKAVVYFDGRDFELAPGSAPLRAFGALARLRLFDPPARRG